LIACVKAWLKNGRPSFSVEDGFTLSLLPEIHPWYRGFTGEIIKSENGKYISWGNITEEKKTKVVDELPIGRWTDNFKDYLENLVEEKVIKKVKNYSTPRKVRFVITESQNGIVCNRKNLKLSKSIFTSNMVLFNEKGVITKYDNVEEIINDFCSVRYEYYKKRKEYQLSILGRDIKFLGNKRRFLKEIMNDDIKLFEYKGKKRVSRKTDDIYKELEKRGYDKQEHSTKNTGHATDPIEEKDKPNGYDYLLRLQFRSMTEEKIEKLKNDIVSKIKDRDYINGKSETDLWIKDLDVFEHAYMKWLKVMEKETIKKRK
jgi:DNA topoisomerase-2